MPYASEQVFYPPAPGYTDFHVHVGERIGGNELAEDFGDLAKLCQSRGLYAIGVFVTENQDNRLDDKLSQMRERAAREYPHPIFWHLTPVTSSIPEVAKVLSHDTDIKLYTTYRQAGLYSSYEQIERYFVELPQSRFLIHCEDDEVIEQHSQGSFAEPIKHCLRRPEEAEIIAVERVLDLAVKRNVALHIVHVSSPHSLMLINQAKWHNPKISCETAPHYLIYNEERLLQPNAHRYICSPPYRSEGSRGLLVELLQDGMIDIIASDHCHFHDEIKDKYKDDLYQVPCGIGGVDSIYTMMYGHFVQSGKISEEALNRMLIDRPLQLMGLENLRGKNEL